MLRILTCAILLLLSTTAPTLAVAEGPWLEVATPNFRFYGNVDETDLWTAAANLERLRGTLAQVTSEEMVQLAVPLQVYVFKDWQSFTAYALRDAASSVEEAGYLVPHAHGIYAALNAAAANPTQLIYRQYIQYLLQSRLPTLPVWFRQGLAEVYSTFRVDGKEAILGWRADLLIRPGSEVAIATPGQGWSVERIVDQPARPEQLGPAGWRSYLDRCRMLSHYLVIADQQRRQQTRDYIRRVARGEDSGTAFRSAYGEDLTLLDRELAAYQEQDQRHFLRISLAREDKPFARARRLANFEVLYHLGDLLLHATPQQRATAAEYFRSALELEPQHGLSWAGLGYVAELGNDWQAAAERYQKAIERQPDEALVQYLYGESLLHNLGNRRPQDAAQEKLLLRARSAFERAVELRPDYAQGWAQLGFTWGLQSGPSAAGTAALERAQSMLPGRQDIAMNLLLAYAKSDQREQADEVYAGLRRTAADPTSLSRARQVLLQMDYRQANRMAAANQLDDAVALLAQVRAHTSDPALAERAAQLLSTLARTAQHNRFAKGYEEAHELIQEGQLKAASAALLKLASEARPGSQKEAINALLDELD